MRLALSVLVVALAAACRLEVGGSCPDLDEVCPDVACADYRVNEDGCAMCACADESALCWDNGDCGAGERCDTVSFCEEPPGCDDGGPCPEACYGRCVVGPAPCDETGGCPDGQRCAAFANDRISVVDSEVAAAVCVDVGCASDEIVLPQCPPGSELVFDPLLDACAPVCLAVDPCRSLSSGECLEREGCGLLPGFDLCVATDDCAARSIESCEANPDCVLRAVGTDAPVPGEDAEPSEDPFALVCVARGIEGECWSDFDCGGDAICALSTVCGAGCASDGSSACFDGCWAEGGTCVPSPATCAARAPESCDIDGACQLVEGPPCPPCTAEEAEQGLCEACESERACVPRGTSCLSDAECGLSEHCELIETCPTCDPSGEDFGCFAPCFVDGRCVDGAVAPIGCLSDDDCAGGTCVPITVCEVCEGSVGEDGFSAPPPCESECYDEQVCVPALCESDLECADGQVCTIDGCTAPPSHCEGDGCGFPGQLCLDDGECGAGFCVFHADVCLDDPARDDPVCSGWCASDCLEVETFARDPESGACIFFPDSCIPPGWLAGC